MKRKIPVVLGIVSGLLLSCNNQNKSIKNNQVMEVTKEEKEGVIRAIDFYVEGGRKADGKITAKAFADTATMSWTENGVLKSVPIKVLYDGFDSSEPMEAHYELTYLNVEKNVAIARIESQFGTNKFADMFTLVKDGEQWKIVSKVYQSK
ncbi:hypothetical protein D0809_10960 [Flavobacterium circumlabens]|uniref:Lumazine-binding protein n=2 Tax=Flavobacterium circumlabens TaxID=2133765 RepID=A0A4Y7UCU5_9FLAO|nr:putative lumazine-binding protein [Flavobacterium circumlabens]TEB44270.1 hypothetical protein D0809_10960 [Flavobacterium circumlabens]